MRHFEATPPVPGGYAWWDVNRARVGRDAELRGGEFFDEMPERGTGGKGAVCAVECRRGNAVTKNEVEAMLARTEKATPGWNYRHSGKFTEGEPGHEETHDYPAHLSVIDKTEEGLRRTRIVAEFSGADLPNDANAEFAAHARTELPVLARDFQEAMEALQGLRDTATLLGLAKHPVDDFLAAYHAPASTQPAGGSE